MANFCGIFHPTQKRIPFHSHAEIGQYEWTDLYERENSYEDDARMIFIFLPVRLFDGDFATSLTIENKREFDVFGELLEKCFISHYGGIYENGIPVKNHESYEACYEATITLLKTLHKGYIEMGIIEKKE